MGREPIKAAWDCIFVPYGAHSWKWRDYIIVGMGATDYVLMRSDTLETVSEHKSPTQAADRAYQIEEMERDVS